MAWDRVIQDSDDEDESIVEDDTPAAIDLPQGAQPSQFSHQHQFDQPSVPQHHTPSDTDQSTRTVITGPDLGVNFDNFLQSQETVRQSASQQRREERWIPSTSEGGGGESIGAMMTEIGLAQQRLLDDDTSSAGQHLPSTATLHSMGLTQTESLPTVLIDQSDRLGEEESGSFVHTRPLNDITYSDTQNLQPTSGTTYDYMSPVTSNYIGSPAKDPTHQLSEDLNSAVNASAQSRPSQKSSHRSKSLQTMSYSPHDTEPLSSNVSSRISRTKSDTFGAGLVSPQQSQHDELSLPTVRVEVPVSKKTRSRSKKQALPEDDEDDELANSRDHEFAAQASVDNGTVAVSGSKIVQSLDSVSKSEKASDKGAVQKSSKPTKEPKKKKVKRGKTSSEVVKKTYNPDVEEDVIWVESGPTHVEDVHQEPFAQNTSASGEKSTTEAQEKPVPKKRGRKRKKTSEDITSESVQQTNVGNAESDTEQPSPDNAGTVIEATTTSQPVSEEATLESSKHPDATPSPQHQHGSLPPMEEKEAPQTPKKPQPTNTETPQDPTNVTVSMKDSSKGPKQHSPIASTSKVPFRVGLSRRARIAPLLRIVRK
ncbi:hypothetical protein N7474_007745 [Penicillium riverlandense]|uniref:uncharacterized protein n=1 Tax=Penicillium riverlandense TaxID=1903569 RepID=UPI0025499594|nr:uncharacterized protein N7474_007745 [Penicillium riverlandense]KAJ5811444.1 hypothetical protein N7474_007745 [Penicillium riverlandense]